MGALYKMVRNMVGTALDVCRGQMEEEEYMLKMLHHHSDGVAFVSEHSELFESLILNSECYEQKQIILKDHKEF